MKTIDIFRRTGGSNLHPKTLVFEKIGEAKVDDQDYDAVKEIRWVRHERGYAYSRMPGTKKNTYLHAVIFQRTGLPLLPGQQVDHKDQDVTNCTRSNLRAATRSIQKANTPVRKDSSTGVKGVYERKGHYYAAATKDHKTTYLGAHTTLDSAARAVNAYYAIHYPDVTIPNPEYV